MKLRTKFVLLIAAIIAIPLLVIYVLINTWLYYANLDEAGPYSLRLRREVLREFPRGLNSESLRGVIQAAPQGVWFLVFDLNRKILASHFPGASRGTFFLPSTEGWGLEKNYPDHRYLLEPLKIDGSTSGWLFLAMPIEPKEFLTEAERTQRIVMAALFVLVLPGVLGGLMVSYLRGSITRLEQATRQVAEGNLDFELPVKGNDEIASLTRSYNRMRKRLKEELAKRSRFLMAVSHDLKTPLTSIRGYLESIADGLAQDPKTLKKHLAIIAEKSRLLEERIIELIEFVRMETGEWRLKHARINLRDFLMQLAKIYKEDALLLNRRFEYHLDLAPDTFIDGDRGLLDRSLENLFNNALRYTSDGDLIQLKAVKTGRVIRLSLEDSGPGIPDTEIPLVFEPFYRGSHSRRESGFGMGLSTVKSILNAHGWEVKLSSTVGKGSVFTISIPPSLWYSDQVLREGEV